MKLSKELSRTEKNMILGAVYAFRKENREVMLNRVDVGELYGVISKIDGINLLNEVGGKEYMGYVLKH